MYKTATTLSPAFERGVFHHCAFARRKPRLEVCGGSSGRKGNACVTRGRCCYVCTPCVTARYPLDGSRHVQRLRVASRRESRRPVGIGLLNSSSASAVRQPPPPCRSWNIGGKKYLREEGRGACVLMCRKSRPSRCGSASRSLASKRRVVRGPHTAKSH